MICCSKPSVPEAAHRARAGEGDEIDVDLDMEPAAVEDLKPTGASKGSKVAHMCRVCVKT